MQIRKPVTYWSNYGPIIEASEINYICQRLKELFNPNVVLPYIFIPGGPLHKSEILENIRLVLNEEA